MNNRLKFRVWDIEEWGYLKCKYSKSAGYHKYTFGKHDVWHDIGYFIENNPKYYIIEQCTGLKDKNGNLIYEGDVVKDEFGRKFKVIWSEEDCMFDGRILYYDPEFGTRFDLYQGATDNSEIIGNIHEQPEQKDK